MGFFARASLAAAASLFAVVAPSLAQPVTWIGAGDGVSWNQAANWSPPALPGATNDVTIPAGATAVTVNVGASIRSLTLDRAITIDGCNILGITNGITFTSAAGVLTTGPFGCESLRFTGTQSISGPGTINCRSGSIRIVGGGTVVAVGTGVLVKNDAAASASVTLDAGTTINNSGTFRGNGASRTLDVSGVASSAFNNVAGGVTEAVNSGIMSITTIPWTNAGTFNINAGTLRLGGSSTAIGTVTRSGGTLELFGTFNGPTLASTAATGIINLFNGFSSTGTSFNASGGGSFFVTGSCSMTGVTLAAPVSFSSAMCGPLAVSGGLTFGPGGSITTGNIGCEHLRFVGTQTLSGTGSINIGGASASIQSGTLTFGPGITLANSGAASGTFSFAPGSTLVNQGTVMSSSGSLAIGSLGATFTNAAGATLGAQSGGTLTLNGVNWSNAGTISVNAATVTLGGTCTNLGTVTRTGGTLNLAATFTGGTITATPATGTLNLSNGAVFNGTLLTGTGGQSFTSNGSLTLNAVTLAAPLQIASSSCGLVTVTGGLTFTPGGSITTGNIGCEQLRFVGTQTIGGTGAINIGTAQAGLISGTLTLAPGVTLANNTPSNGVLALTAGTTLINQGTIRSSGNTLTLNGAVGSTFTNAAGATLGTQTNGVLTLIGSTWSNAGTISVNTGTLTLGGVCTNLGTVTRTGGTFSLAASFTGGTVSATAATGNINLSAGSAFNGTLLTASGGATFTADGSVNLIAVTLATPLQVTSSACALVTVTGGLTFTAGGSIATGNIGCEQLRFVGTQSVTGPGTIGIGTASASVNSGILTIESPVLLTNNAPGNCVLTIGSGASIINNSTVRASTGSLYINGTGGAFTNSATGTIAALAGGNLTVNDVTWTNAGNVTINGGTLTMNGTGNGLGNVTRTGGTYTLGCTYTNPSLALTAATGSVILSTGFSAIGTNISASGGSTFSVNGSITLSGVTLAASISGTNTSCSLTTVTNGLTFAPGGSLATANIGCEQLRFSGNQTIGGTGTISIGTAPASVVGGTVTFGPGITLANGAGVNGTISLSAGSGILNQGTIRASGNTLSFTGAPGSTITNAPGGTLGAQSAGTLSIVDVTWTNNGTLLINNATVNLAGVGNALGNVNRTGGTLTLAGSYTGPTLALTAATGSVSLSSGFAITGTTLTASGGSTFIVIGNASFTGVTLGTALSLSSATCGLLTINGGLTFAPGGSITTGNIGCEHLRFTGTQTVAGTGNINLKTASMSVFTGTLTVGPSVTITNAAGANGTINVADGAHLVNQGTMLASGAARSLTVVNNLTGDLVNQGSLEARNGGTFIDSLPTTNNAFIRAGTGGTFTVSTGRTLTNSATGTIEIEGTGPNATSDFGHIRVQGTLAAAGTIAVSYPNGLIPGCLIGVNILNTQPGGTITGAFANRVGPAKPAPFASLIAISGSNYLFTSTNQADVGSAGGVAQPDGILDNNDFIVYIDLFFATSPIADRGTTGGIPGADGVFDNNDFIVYIDQFFAGCG